MIAIEDLSITFGRGTPNQVEALKSVSLQIPDHQFIVVIGTNGSGKSTLLNALAGSVIPDRGRISIGETEITRMPNHQRARFIGRVFQNPFTGTAPTMTVAENLRLASLRGKRKGLVTGLRSAEVRNLRERAAELGMGLEDRIDTPIGLLSGGERQALTLLMATLNTPGLLLLDEHTAALDPRSAEQVLALTERVVTAHRLTTLMVTHDMDEAIRFGSRLVMMHEGRIALDVSGEEKRGMGVVDLLGRFRRGPHP